MIEENMLEVGNVVFIHSLPVDQALIGVIRSIAYPIIQIIPVRKGKKQTQIDISTDIPLSVLDNYGINRFLSSKERKALQEAKQVIRQDEEDLFA